MYGQSGTSHAAPAASSPERAAVERHFTDCVGVEWTVLEIHPADLSGLAISLFPHTERRSGWLLFESGDSDRRRLAPFPSDWGQVSDFELERWCMRATPVAPTESRRRTD